ncbi:FkbM family methyltransferase [Desulfovibrio sp. OttesenSCG-928-M14]|nr:FkbM family methyltransferase [Desulfovibrio sp. OttesenSCG-928-M14]
MNAFRASLMPLLKEHIESSEHRYTDNHWRYFTYGDSRFMARDLDWFASHQTLSFKRILSLCQDSIARQVAEKSELFSLLADEDSRRALLADAAYSIIGHRRVKFPWYREGAIQRMAALHAQCLCADVDEEEQNKYTAKEFTTLATNLLYDASSIGLPARLYTNKVFLYALDGEHDYRYQSADVSVDVEPGDYVLDCGACLGDTALLFAHKAGKEGAVLSFEPNPLLYLAFADNMKRNEALSARIRLEDCAVSDMNDQILSFSLSASSSSLSDNPTTEGPLAIKVQATTIDRVVQEAGLPRVDFIKMDVEGAELAALRGALRTIVRFRPKLAICVYHNYGDYKNIPEFIQSLDLGYRLYLKKHFMNNWESVLYAKAE